MKVIPASEPKKRARPRHLESKLQISCVRWAKIQYPALKRLLFAIPNGGARSAIEGSIMKGEGVTAGVADLFLSIPAIVDECLWAGLYIEMKYGDGAQSADQIAFQLAVSCEGYYYVVCSDFDTFKVLVDWWMTCVKATPKGTFGYK